MARRRQKIGLLRTVAALGAVAEASKGQMLKNQYTDAVRGAFGSASKYPGGSWGKAVAMVIIPQVAAVEVNKLRYNPSFGPVRLL